MQPLAIAARYHAHDPDALLDRLPSRAGRLGPKVLDLAIKRWLKRANEVGVEPRVRRQPLGSVTALHFQQDAGIDERM